MEAAPVRGRTVVRPAAGRQRPTNRQRWCAPGLVGTAEPGAVEREQPGFMRVVSILVENTDRPRPVS
nr:hypothetical protein KPHV_73890 [Kitasatospora purpeofusca]